MHRIHDVARLAALRLAAFFFGALRLAAFFIGALRLATLRLAAFFFGALRLATLRFVAFQADDFLVLVVRAAAIVFLSGSVSCVASGSSAEVVFSVIANLVLNGCSMGMMIVGSSSFKANRMKTSYLRERLVESKLQKSREC